MKAQWYLMNAKALTGKQSVPITEVMKHWTSCCVYVVVTRGGRKMFACSAGGLMGDDVGMTKTWVNDTGMGHRSPGYAHDTLTIENVVTYADGEMTSNQNQIGLLERRPLWVFK